MWSVLRQVMNRWRAAVPTQARRFVVLAAMALTLGTWGPVLAVGVGVKMVGWEHLVRQCCAPFCHQLPGRSFDVTGHVCPLCARCTGMWLGITLGVALAMLWVPRHRWLGGTLTAIGFTAASAFDFLREEATGVGYGTARAVLGFFLFLGVTLTVSFDVLAVLVAGLRWFANLSRRALPGPST
jgi:uncharacterized membrane protein